MSFPTLGDWLMLQQYNTFRPQSASHSTSLNQMQSVHWPGYHTHRLVPYRASALGLTDHQIMSRDQPASTSRGAIMPGNPRRLEWHPQARITHLIPYMPRQCSVIHEAHGLLQPLLALLYLTGCCTEPNITINVCLAIYGSRQIADSTHTKQIRQAAFTRIKFFFEISFFSAYNADYVILIGSCLPCG